jgi:hypothetical protein
MLISIVAAGFGLPDACATLREHRRVDLAGVGRPKVGMAMAGMQRSDRDNDTMTPDASNAGKQVLPRLSPAISAKRPKRLRRNVRD